jgi:hypothetical protein
MRGRAAASDHARMSAEVHAANRRGVLAVAAGMACFVANDTSVKYVGQSLPASQLILLRGVMA